jgi:hypothetical protein
MKQPLLRFTTANMKAGLDEVRRVIREQEPVRPSTRLTRLFHVDLTAVAQARHTEPRALVRTLRGDLNWIVMKALEKDRTRRYATVQGLELDIHRFLRNEAVSACPPSPNADEVSVNVHATSVTPGELGWFSTFNLPFGQQRRMETVNNKEQKKEIQ